jgi:hypothetical protein
MLGNATGCGALITVTAVDGSGKATAFTVANTGNGNPFDGSDDVLVGILNNSAGNLTSITLSSTDTTFGGIFGFDGDGPCDFLGTGFDCYNDGAPADVSSEADPLDYEGPNNTFTVGTPVACNTTESGQCYTNGTVNFVTPASPNGIPPASQCDQPCNSTWFALEGTPQSLVIVGPMVPVTAGTSTLSPAGAPVTQTITIPTGTTFGNVAFIQLTETPEDPATFNAGRFPPGTPNTFSGGSAVPSSVQCLSVNGACVDELLQCFDANGNQLPNHCLGIVPPQGTVINLNSTLTTPSGFHNLALLIASDGLNDWANITNFVDPGDACTRPPCGVGGGTTGLNSETVVADLSLSCQVLTYALNPTSGPPGTKVTVTGSLKGCTVATPGAKTAFGTLLASLTFRFTGPIGSSCTVQSVTSPALPLIVPLKANLPFQFQLKVPSNACPGTSEVTSSILSGVVSYEDVATFTVP